MPGATQRITGTGDPTPCTVSCPALAVTGSTTDVAEDLRRVDRPSEAHQKGSRGRRAWGTVDGVSCVSLGSRGGVGTARGRFARGSLCPVRSWERQNGVTVSPLCRSFRSSPCPCSRAEGGCGGLGELPPSRARTDATCSPRLRSGHASGVGDPSDPRHVSALHLRGGKYLGALDASETGSCADLRRNVGGGTHLRRLGSCGTVFRFRWRRWLIRTDFRVFVPLLVEPRKNRGSTDPLWKNRGNPQKMPSAPCTKASKNGENARKTELLKAKCMAKMTESARTFVRFRPFFRPLFYSSGS